MGKITLENVKDKDAIVEMLTQNGHGDKVIISMVDIDDFFKCDILINNILESFICSLEEFNSNTISADEMKLYHGVFANFLQYIKCFVILRDNENECVNRYEDLLKQYKLPHVVLNTDDEDFDSNLLQIIKITL